MEPPQKTQGSPPIIASPASQRDFVEQYWVAQYFGNRVLRTLLRICPWHYRQWTSTVQREWKRARLGRAEYRSVEWMVRRYGVVREATVSAQWISVTYAEWESLRAWIPEAVTAALFSDSLRRHVVDVQWTSGTEAAAGHGPSFIEANCRFSTTWPPEVPIPRQVRPWVTAGERTVLWMQPPGVVSQEALRLFFSVLSAVTGLRQMSLTGLYEAEMNFGPYQVFGLSLPTIRRMVSDGMGGLYYDDCTDTVWIVDFYFGAVYNYLYRMLHQS